MHGLNVPYYTWTHRHSYFDSEGNFANRTLVYKADKDPTYARRKRGVPPQILHAEDFNSCFSMLDDIERQVMLP
jgi:hypothetical protein